MGLCHGQRADRAGGLCLVAFGEVGTGRVAARFSWPSRLCWAPPASGQQEATCGETESNGSGLVSSPRPVTAAVPPARGALGVHRHFWAPWSGSGRSHPPWQCQPLRLPLSVPSPTAGRQTGSSQRAGAQAQGPHQGQFPQPAGLRPLPAGREGEFVERAGSPTATEAPAAGPRAAVSRPVGPLSDLPRGGSGHAPRFPGGYLGRWRVASPPGAAGSSGLGRSAWWLRPRA